MKKEVAVKYAELIVKMGVNVLPGQLVVITCPVEHADFSVLVAQECYKAKACYVDVRYNNDYITALNMTHGDMDYIAHEKEYIKVRNDDDIAHKVCYIHLTSDLLGVMDDADDARLLASRKASMAVNKNRRQYTGSQKGQWTIAALPNQLWANKVFPNMEPDKAYEALEKAILDTVYVNENEDAIANWEKHNKTLAHLVEVLNNYNFKELHFKNSIGTDICVPLVENHLWSGGSCDTVDGVSYNANMPTEEVFCMPDYRKTQGKVVASKPLSYNGKIIDEFWMEFDQGKVVNFGAKENQQVLSDIIHGCKGADSIGEIALISYHSPISLQNILYFDTLFDENASCHMALGSSYSENLKGGINMSEDEIYALGGNQSDNHVDFMFGTSDMQVTGICHDGSSVAVFENGDFVIE